MRARRVSSKFLPSPSQIWRQSMLRSLEVSGFSLPARYRQTFRADFFEGLTHELLLPATCFLDKNVVEKEPLVDLQIRGHK